VLSVVVTTCYEPVSKGVVVFFQFILMYGVWEGGIQPKPPHWLLEGKLDCRDLMGDAGWSFLVLWQSRPERFLPDG
jgi:hypothetical protein